jgi:hypothetical protein
VTRVGFLHTAEVHVATFTELVAAADPGATAEHVVEPALLALARSGSPEVGPGLRAALARLADADVVVCTCSTLGPLAESLGALRVDRPMAREAVRLGPRIAVVAALESTLEPTRALLLEEAAAELATPALEVVLAEGAWAAFEAGDPARYLELVAAAARSAALDADVVVLAQASMLGALDLLADLPVPVLASPPLAVRAALA